MALIGPKVSVTQQRATRVADGIGGFTETWAAVETMNVTLSPMSETEKLQYSKDTTTTIYTLHVDHGGRDIRTQDRFLYGAKVLNVIAAPIPMSMLFMYRCILMEVR